MSSAASCGESSVCAHLGVAFRHAFVGHRGTELAYVSMQVRAQTFRVLEMLTAMAVLYWLLGYPQAKLVDWMQRRMKVTE